MSLAQLTNEVLALPLEERMELAQKLWESLPPGPESEFAHEEAEIQEMLRRDAEMDAGTEPEVDFRQALAEIRKSL